MMEVNFVAVLVAGLVAMAVGALWYSPLLFGKMWMKLSGLTAKDMEAAKKKGMTKSYVGNLVANLVMAYVLAHLIALLGLADVSAAARTAFWIWLGFVATVSLNGVWWEGKKLQAWVLNNGSILIQLLLMAAILVSWK